MEYVLYFVAFLVVSYILLAIYVPIERRKNQKKFLRDTIENYKNLKLPFNKGMFITTGYTYLNFFGK